MKQYSWQIFSEQRHLGNPPNTSALLLMRRHWRVGPGEAGITWLASWPRLPPRQSHARSIIKAQRGVCFHFNNSPQMIFLKAPVKRAPSIIYQLSVWQMLFFFALCSARHCLDGVPPQTPCFCWLPYRYVFFLESFLQTGLLLFRAAYFLMLDRLWICCTFAWAERAVAGVEQKIFAFTVFILTARLKWLWQRWAAVALFGWRASHPGEMQLEYFSMVIVRDLYA